MVTLEKFRYSMGIGDEFATCMYIIMGCLLVIAICTVINLKKNHKKLNQIHEDLNELKILLGDKDPQ